MPAVALAPWSSLRLSDDPACKDPGWRTTLQVIAPWIRVATPELRVEDLDLGEGGPGALRLRGRDGEREPLPYR